MNTREQFGKYLLLKKLTEDSLGETFRAGLLSTGGMERVTLLRVFNGQGLDGPRLWEAVKDREGIQKILHSPNIGEGVEMGELQGIPYVAYDYVSGKNMATLLEQAAKKQNFIPAEHALLIAERLALALAAACENRHDGDRILHGFLVPQLTMISNEGEIRLLGFEVAKGLRAFAGNPVIRQHFGRYLAPEALSGALPDRTDDIYSLGVILFELLTGRPLPPPAVDGYDSLIDQGMLGAEGEPIPPALVQLLKSSLVARTERINDVAVWHKNLSTWLFEEQYNPTTFNLAFFMHNLFREEIERESQEIEVEKTLPLPVVKQPEPTPMPEAVPTAAPQQPQPFREDTGVSEATENFIPEYARETEKSKLGLYIAIAAVVVAILAGVFWWTTQRGSAPPPEETVAAAPEPTPVPPAEEIPPAPTEEEIAALMAEIDERVKQSTNEFAAELRAQQDKQLQALRQQLDEARRAAELRRQQLEEQQQAREEAEAEAARLAEQEAAAEESAPEEEETVEVAAQPEPPVEEPVAEPTPPPTPPKPQVRRGDLVQPGPGVVPPRKKRIVARYPAMARRIGRKQATVVVVKVLVDENGKASKVELEGKKVGFGFDTEALQAARTGTYEAATKNGVPVKCWLTVKVEFQPR
ncbi:MAG: TonB family protein [bacterium]|nr:TonB family protein [bacterium]